MRERLDEPRHKLSRLALRKSSNTLQTIVRSSTRIDDLAVAGIRFARSHNITYSMATQYVSDDIRDFILKHIVSVAQIEALLLIWSNPGERWGLRQIAARIYASDTETAKRLMDSVPRDCWFAQMEFRLEQVSGKRRMIGRLRKSTLATSFP